MSSIKRLLTYFGLAGNAPPQPAWWAIFEAVPPLLVAAVGAWLDSADGWVGFALLVLYLSLAWAVWLPVVIRFTPWRSGPGK